MAANPVPTLELQLITEKPTMEGKIAELRLKEEENSGSRSITLPGNLPPASALSNLWIERPSKR